MSQVFGHAIMLDGEKFRHEVEEEAGYWLTPYLRPRLAVWVVGYGPSALTFASRKEAVNYLINKWLRIQAILDAALGKRGLTYSRRQAMGTLFWAVPIRRIEIPRRPV